MKELFLEKVKKAGVVGAGGAGFPTHMKLAAQAEYLLVNGAECEPLIRVDQQLMGSYAELLVGCVEKLTQALGFKKAYICIKRKHKEVIVELHKYINKNCNVELFLLEDFYPAGDEQVLVYEVTGRVVPEGSIPIKVGCIVLNVETVLNINSAWNSEPVTEKYLTVTGEVPTPLTLRLPIGTSIKTALKIAGLEDTKGKAVIDGGPMMGKFISDFEAPVTKTTKGLIVIDETHHLVSSTLR